MRAIPAVVLALAGWIATAATCRAAEPYPFEGNWIRADRTCSASTARERIYTSHDVVSPRSRCTIRKVVAGAGTTFELFERCERPNEHAVRISEIIRLSGPDTMVVTRKTSRLKLTRPLRFARCAPAPVGPKGPAPAPSALPKPALKPKS